jgi:hypothetical protein
MMKAYLQKTIDQLKPSERARLEAEIFDRLDEELCQAQFVWLKMACIILHDMGISADDIILFIGGWKMMYRANSRCQYKSDQDAFLEPRIKEIFGEGGFPEEFMQSFKEIGR